MKKKVTGIGGIFFKAKDPEGNKIEHWEPLDEVFTDEYEGKKPK